MRRSKHRRVISTLLCGAVLAASGGPATAHRRPGPNWKYQRRVRHHRTWDSHAGLRARHSDWHQDRTVVTTHEVTGEDGQTTTSTAEDVTYTDEEHQRFHHSLVHRHMRRRHGYRVVGRQRGGASWYDYRGQVGACGKVLRGMYAAHRTWPCGTKVAVRSGGEWVHVRVLDRGPFVSGWVIDLSPRAFRKLAPLGAGVIDVGIYRLKKR